MAMFWVLTACCICNVVSGQTATDMRNLLSDLFTTSNYTTKIRPKNDQSYDSWVSVTIDFYLVGINDFNELSEKLSTVGFLEIRWDDEFLVWTPPKYGNISNIHHPQVEVWKPDISLQNGFTKLKELGSSLINVAINYDGAIKWRPFEVFETRCTIDSTFFPFDEQTCELVFVSWSYHYRQVRLDAGAFEKYEYFASNAEWSVTDTKASVMTENIIVKVIFTLTIERKPLYYILNLLAPIILLSLLNLFTFAIPCDSGERTGYSITVWLSFAVFLTIITDNLPTGSTSVVAVYAMFQLFLTTVVVIICTIQLRINGYPEEKKVPYGLYRMVMFFDKRRENSVTPLEKDQNLMDELQTRVTWKKVVSVMDFMFFWFLLFSVIISTVICCCYIALFR